MRIDLTYTRPQLEIFFNQPEHVKYLTVTKGRRFGATKGAANAFIEYAIEGRRLLWGDTINSNIDRYFERYMQPELKKHDIPYNWNSQKKELKILNGWIDFRSADRPENWEGFGYDNIFLNEAGIILKNEYLYTNAVLPMLLDNPNSKLIAAGVPKGKVTKNKEKHIFYKLYQSAKEGKQGHALLEYTSYDNPLLKEDDIKQLENEILGMSPEMVMQEIYGQFIDGAATRPFAFAFDEKKHVSDMAFQRPDLAVKVSIDFNVEPFTAVLAHVFRDKYGEHFHIFDEISVSKGSIEEMAQRILAVVPNRMTLNITGDAMGNNRRVKMRESDNNSLFGELIKRLGISRKQLTVKRNPFHKVSRENYNFMLAQFPDFKIHPKCVGVIRDHKIVEVDEFGSIKKSDRSKLSQQADYIDNCRYLQNTFLSDWVRANKRVKSK